MAWLLAVKLIGSAIAAVVWVFAATPSPRGGGLGVVDPTTQSPAEIAARPAAYLVLELGAARLRLMHGGAVLRDYPITDVEIGRPAVMFFRRASPGLSPAVVWEEGRLDPPRAYNRAVLSPAVPVAAGDSAPVWIPPEPEEAFPAPDRYLVRFGGLSIEVRGEGEESRKAEWEPMRAARFELRELAQSISRHPEIRLRLTLPAAEAGALYRSLPVPARLIVAEDFTLEKEKP